MGEEAPAVVYTRQAVGGGPPLLGISEIYGPNWGVWLQALIEIEFNRKGPVRGLSLCRYRTDVGPPKTVVSSKPTPQAT